MYRFPVMIVLTLCASVLVSAADPKVPEKTEQKSAADKAAKPPVATGFYSFVGPESSGGQFVFHQAQAGQVSYITLKTVLTSEDIGEVRVRRADKWFFVEIKLTKPACERLRNATVGRLAFVLGGFLESIHEVEDVTADSVLKVSTCSSLREAKTILDLLDTKPQDK